jgi:hypothetical protein
MRFALCLLLLGCGLTGPEGKPDPVGPAPGESACPERDYRVDVVITESICADGEPPGPEITCGFEGCDRAFWCAFDDGSREYNDGTAGLWVLEQGSCSVTYRVTFPPL